MTYFVSIAIVSQEFGIGDGMNFTCSDTFQTREVIHQLCNGWNMRDTRVVFINGKFAAFGNPSDIRTAIAEVGISTYRTEQEA